MVLVPRGDAKNSSDDAVEPGSTDFDADESSH